MEALWMMGVGRDVLGVWLGAAAGRRSVSPHMSSGTCAVTQRPAKPVGRCFGRVKWRFSTEDRDRSDVGELRPGCPFLRSGLAACRPPDRASTKARRATRATGELLGERTGA